MDLRTAKSTQLTGNRTGESYCSPLLGTPRSGAYWNKCRCSRKPSGVQVSTYMPTPSELHPQTLCWEAAPSGAVTKTMQTEVFNSSWHRVTGTSDEQTELPTAARQHFPLFLILCREKALNKVSLKAFGSTPSVQVYVSLASTAQSSTKTACSWTEVLLVCVTPGPYWPLNNPQLQGGKDGHVQRTVQE